MAAKKKKKKQKKAVTSGSAQSTSSVVPEAKAKKKKDEKKAKKSKKGVFNRAAFRTEVSGPPPKKGELPPVDIIPFASENVVGHSAGVISSQSIAMDKAIGIGGYPRGRIIEVSGVESVGKTTAVGHAIASLQRAGGHAMIVDTEEKLDLPYMARLGVDVDALDTIQSRRKTFESIFDAIARACEHWTDQELAHIPLGIFWDSVGSTPTESEFDKDAGEAQMVGRAQKLLKGAMRTLPQRLAQANAFILAVNHLYTNIQTGFAAKFGVKKVTYGGIALRYAATLRLELVRTGGVKLSDDSMVGAKVLIKVQKNNVAMPMNNQEVAVMWGVGFDDYVTIFWKLQEHRYISFGGGWFTFKSSDGVEKKWQQTFVGFRAVCQEDPEFYALTRRIYNALP